MAFPICGMSFSYAAMSTTPQSPASDAKASSFPSLLQLIDGDGALAGAAKQGFLVVREPNRQDHAVDEADGKDILGRVGI